MIRMATLPEDIDSVDWSAMRVGSGRPQDIPYLLRRLADPADEHELYESVGSLHAIVMHEHSGCLVESSEHVIPFLIALCGSSHRSVAAHALMLLVEFVTSVPYWAEVEHGNIGLRERVYDATMAGLPTYYELLGNADPLARTAAVGVLGILDRDSERFAGALAQVLVVDDDPGVRGGAETLLAHATHNFEDVEWGLCQRGCRPPKPSRVASWCRALDRRVRRCLSLPTGDSAGTGS